MKYLLLVPLVLFVAWVLWAVIDTISEWRWVNRCEREYRINPQFRAYIDELDARIAARKTHA